MGDILIAGLKCWGLVILIIGSFFVPIAPVTLIAAFKIGRSLNQDYDSDEIAWGFVLVLGIIIAFIAIFVGIMYNP